MNREDVMRGVCECIAAVVDIAPTSVRESDCVIGDLGADSLDLLDLVFHLEQRFKVRITPRGIEREAQAKLGGVPIEIDGVYTREALAELRKALPEIPPEEMREGLRTAELPRRFRVATFVNLVCRLTENRHE
jgi:acyl carrier protein